MHLEQRILLTGGSGFLGSHLCDRPVGKEISKNIEHLLRHQRFALNRHDVTFPLDVEVDRIYNLACPVSPIHDQVKLRKLTLGPLE